MGLKIGDTVALPKGATLADGSWNPSWIATISQPAKFPALIPGGPVPGRSSFGSDVGSIFDGYGIGMQPPGSRSDGSLRDDGSWKSWLMGAAEYAGREALDAVIRNTLNKPAASGDTPTSSGNVTSDGPAIYYPTTPAAGGVSPSTLLLLGVVGFGGFLMLKAVK